MPNQYDLLEEIKLNEFLKGSPEEVLQNFKDAYEAIEARYPRYHNFNYITIENFTGGYSVCLYGMRKEGLDD